MKKILFVVMASLAMTFASCGNRTCGASSQCDSDSVSVTVDSVSADSAVADSATVCLL